MRFLLPVAICSLLSLTSAYAEGEPFLTFYQGQWTYNGRDVTRLIHRLDPGCPEGTGLDVRKQDMQRCIVMPGLRPQGQSIRLHPQEGAKGCLQIYTGAECTGEITYGYNIDRGELGR